MNDRLKFRYWDKNKKEYIKTQCHCLALHWSSFVSVWCAQRDNGTYSTRLGEIYNDMDIIPEQCTGLKDKNGNLIYEGDIVRFEIIDDDSVLGKTFERICEICFGKGDYSYSFVCKNNAYYRGYALLSSILCQEIESIEIIGNIHEQAEQKDKQ